MSKAKIPVYPLATLSERIAMAEALRGPNARLPGEEDPAYAKRKGRPFPNPVGASDYPPFVPLAH